LQARVQRLTVLAEYPLSNQGADIGVNSAHGKCLSVTIAGRRFRRRP
jgi:hypothetical protein